MYRGVFNRIHHESDTVASAVVFLSLSEQSNSFVLSPDTIQHIPYACSGQYFVSGTDKITFVNKAFINDTLYDPLYVLDTTYTFTYDEVDCRCKVKVDTVTYDYFLNPF